MNSESLSLDLEYVSSSGVVLSVEKKACLLTSLTLVKQNYKYQNIKFWGVIRGIQNDYYIIQGTSKDQIRSRKGLYSQDCLEWKILPHVDESLCLKSSLLQGRFTGDPSFIIEHKVTNRVGIGDDAAEKTTSVEMKEEERLAAVVARIDEEVAIVPRGSYIRTPHNEVVANKSFQGLPLNEAKLPKYYFHFKEPDVDDVNKTITESVDFLTSIDQDIPKGSWSIQCDHGGTVVVLRSLKWLGFVAYHVPDTSKYGYVYCGTGEKNMDLLFML